MSGRLLLGIVVGVAVGVAGTLAITSATEKAKKKKLIEAIYKKYPTTDASPEILMQQSVIFLQQLLQGNIS